MCINGAERKHQLGRLYNANQPADGGKRNWLRYVECVFVLVMTTLYSDVLLEESDSESDGDQTISEQDLRILLKIHRTRRKYQKKYHTDPTVFMLFS